MEKHKLWNFMPSVYMYKNMVQKEVTFFEYDHRTRFTVTSRHVDKYIPGIWVNHWRCLPYEYRWSPEEEKLLPEHYKQRCRDFMYTEPQPVHWRPDPKRYRFDEFSGEKIPTINAPVQVVYPEECNKGLWGGEGVIMGYFRKVLTKRIEQKKEPTLPTIWVPEVSKMVMYSEILDRYMSIPMTQRALYLVDESFGFDNYILETHESDLCSKLGMLLKRQMLEALASQTMYSNNPQKRDKILKRYEQFIIPLEEAEYVGLKVSEAVEKARKTYEEENPSVPLKDLYILKMVKELHLSPSTS